MDHSSSRQSSYSSSSTSSSTYPTVATAASLLCPPTTNLRQACDRCSVAKVKCDKAHPSCARCLESKQPCNYSASRRGGKRNRLPQVTPRSAAATSTVHPQSRQRESPQAAHSRSTPPNTRAPDSAGEPVPLPPRNIFDPVEDWVSAAFEIPSGIEDSDRDNAHLWMTPPSLFSTSNSTIDASLARGDVSAWNLPTTPDGNIIACQTPLAPQAEDVGHDCEPLALEILDSLRIAPGRLSSGLAEYNKAAPSWPDNVSTQSTPTTDFLLYTNRLALSRVTNVLTCACAQSPNISFLLSAILFKVLHWYRSIAKAANSSNASRVGTTKIQYGLLELNDDDQVRLQRAVLQQELGKMGKLLDRLAVSFRRNLSERDCNGVDRSSHWQGLVTSRLREELQKAMREAKNELTGW